MWLRLSCGARGEQHRRGLVCGKARNRVPCRVMRQIRWIVENDGTVRHNGIDEAIDIRIVRREPIEHCRRVVRWQQSDLPAAERRGKADSEAIAIPAKIDHMAAPWQPCRERGDIGEVTLGGD